MCIQVSTRAAKRQGNTCGLSIPLPTAAYQYMASTIRKMQLHTAFAMNRKHPQPSAERRAYATTIRAPANTFPSRARFSHHPCHATPCDFRPLCHQAEGRSNTTTPVVKAEESNSHKPVPRFYLSRLSAQQSILRLRGTKPALSVVPETYATRKHKLCSGRNCRRRRSHSRSHAVALRLVAVLAQPYEAKRKHMEVKRRIQSRLARGWDVAGRRCDDTTCVDAIRMHTISS